MADFKFDGKYFTDRSGKKLGEVDGNYVKNYSNSSKVAEVDGDYIKDYSNSRKVIEISGNDIKDYSNSRKVATMDDIRKQIDGHGGKTLVALWWYFIYR